MSEPVIEFSDLSFTYHGSKTESLSHISFSVEEGEFILLTGKSGCGKTTLTRCINGLIPDFFEGELTGSGKVCSLSIGECETGDFASKVGSVFQDPRSQFFTLHVKTEIPFPSENLGMDVNKMHKNYKDVVRRFEIQDLLNKSIFDLSSGEKQKIAIASVYMAGAGIYVFDEPSANLDVEGTRQLREVLRTLKEQGNTIIISEHKLYYLKGLEDKVLLMKDGKIEEEISGSEFDRKPSSWYEAHGLRQCSLLEIHAEKGNKSFTEHEICAEHLSFGYPKSPILWHDVSFLNHGGEIIGIVGKNGSGKSTLIRTLMGLEKPKTGKLSIDKSYVSKQKRRSRSFYVMQDVDYQLFAPSVQEEMLVGTKKTMSDKRKAFEILEQFGLSDFAERHPTALSGGQKQRLSIALAAMSEKPILCLDEPTSGLDAKNMKIVQEQIRKLAEKGRCIYVITHDYEFAAGLFSSLMMIQEDHTVTYLSPDEYKPENLMNYFIC